MKTLNGIMAYLLIGMLAIGLASSAQAQTEQAPTHDTQQTAQIQPQATQQLPDAPIPQSAEHNAQAQGSQANPSQPATQNSATQNGQTAQPVGTAAAQPLITTGVAASKPAGIALAEAEMRQPPLARRCPAKEQTQARSRLLTIKRPTTPSDANTMDAGSGTLPTLATRKPVLNTSPCGLWPPSRAPVDTLRLPSFSQSLPRKPPNSPPKPLVNVSSH